MLDSFTPTDLKQLLISDSHQTVQLEEIERLDDVRDGWSRLAEAAGHPFATWEWNSAWWLGLGPADRSTRSRAEIKRAMSWRSSLFMWRPGDRFLSPDSSATATCSHRCARLPIGELPRRP
jgi:hypothetical protein